MKNINELKVLFPTSSGGHLKQLMLVKDIFKDSDRVWVTFNKVDAQSLLEHEKKYWCYYPTNRNFINLIKNFFLAFKILKKEKPDIIISTGAAIAIPFFFLGKMFKAKRVYIEVFDRIDSGTLSGKFCYKHCDKFIVQWPEQKNVYKNSIYLGSIF